MNKAPELIKYIKEKTNNDNIGKFCALIDINGYKNPVAALSTDGVGSKLHLAKYLGGQALVNIGIDLVAMCVNDIICHGATPISFLDYYVTKDLNLKESKYIIDGIIQGCELSGCRLEGGEIAEIPTLHTDDGFFDLAGFCFGLVEKENVKPKNIEEGDYIIGLKSSGIHCNGFTQLDWYDLEDSELWELITPTKIYADSCLSVMEDLNGLAHITGGGIYENVARVIPDGLCADVILPTLSSLYTKIYLGEFDYNDRDLSYYDMLNIFNCGIGMVLIVSKYSDVNFVIKYLTVIEEDVSYLGTIKEGNEKVVVKI